MTTEAKGLVIEIEDDDFLSQVAAAEAQALANKRRRVSIAPSQNAAVPFSSGANPKDGSDGGNGDGGLYTAALKGSQRAPPPDPPRGGFSRGRVNVGVAGNDDVSAGGGSCFKCGKPGHWARDCDATGGGIGGGGGGGGYYGNFGGGGDFSSSISVPEKSCPCGSGACVVLTANTEKNRGRKFYKCPLRLENGSCGFFEWCDNSSSGPPAMASSGTGSGNATKTQSYASDSSFPALECPCGGGFCLILTAKTGKNIGSQFYRCPATEGSSCGFFKWCNEQNVAAAVVPGGGAKVQYSSSQANNSGNGVTVRGDSSCFKCGKEGHWARDCPAVPSYSAPVELGVRSSSPNTCFKCGKPGHWARDCPSG